MTSYITSTHALTPKKKTDTKMSIKPKLCPNDRHIDFDKSCPHCWANRCSKCGGDPQDCSHNAHNPDNMSARLWRLDCWGSRCWTCGDDLLDGCGRRGCDRDSCYNCLVKTDKDYIVKCLARGDCVFCGKTTNPYLLSDSSDCDM